MSAHPVSNPSAVERTLFGAGLVGNVSLAEVYDVRAGTSAQRASLDPEHYRRKPDVHDSDDWANESGPARGGSGSPMYYGVACAC
jgi:hypothetical protein